MATFQRRESCFLGRGAATERFSAIFPDHADSIGCARVCRLEIDFYYPHWRRQLVFVPEEQDVRFKPGEALDKEDLGDTLLSNGVKVDGAKLKENRYM